MCAGNAQDVPCGMSMYLAECVGEGVVPRRALSPDHLTAMIPASSLPASSLPADPHAPRILECESDWKVSPYGDAAPDRDCYWVATYEEALEELAAINAERNA